MKIVVSKRHIKVGHAGSHDRCPIALAVREVVHKSCLPEYFGKSFKVDVSDDVMVSFGKVRLRMLKTQQISRFIRAFDNKRKVKPFAFNFKPFAN